MEQIREFYKHITKRCICLSSRCTINLINGLYGTDYPPDSKVTYNWTKDTGDELKRTLADNIITINDHDSYGIEFQMTADGDIILRILEYSSCRALKTTDSPDTIIFPKLLVVYLYNGDNLPDNYTLNIQFGSQGTFQYIVPVFRYLEKPMEELEERKLIVLLPFQLLRLKKAIENARTPENITALRKLICQDIKNSINQNVAASNITQAESIKLRQIVFCLYQHIYSKYEELKKEGINYMVEEALIFETDSTDCKVQEPEGKNQSSESTNQLSKTADRSLVAATESLVIANRSLEVANQAFESSGRSIESVNRSLESVNQLLKSANQLLESANQSLTFGSQVWKLYARGASADEIAEKTGQPASRIKAILEA